MIWRALGRTTGEVEYLPALDGVRGISLLAVVMFHAGVVGAPGGFLGVEAFFVVSGYLITSLLVAEFDRTGTISLTRFWMRRARRLLPALAALLAAATAVSALCEPSTLAASRADLPAAILFASNWWQIARGQSYLVAVERPPLLQHLWSLAVEEQFYLVWPILFGWLARRIPLRWLAAGALTAALASAAWLVTLFNPNADPTNILLRSDTRSAGILFGVALALALRPRGPACGGPAAKPGPAIERAGVLGLAVLFAAFWRLDASTPLVYRGGLVLVDLATVAVVAAVAHTQSRLGRVLGARPLVWIGRRSYGLYLWHWPVFALTRPELDLSLGALPLLLVRLGVTLAVSELCYRLIEKPWRRDVFAQPGATPIRRPWAAGVVIATIAIALVTSVGWTSRRPDEGSTARLATSASESIGDRTLAVVGSAPAFDPRWPKTLTVLADSVALGLREALPRAMPDWTVEFIGRPALTVRQVIPEYLQDRGVGSVVVIGLGYNSLFEKQRRGYSRWAERWDDDANELLANLQARGAKKIVWVTLSEPPPELVSERDRWQYDRYAWVFAYVNERLNVLVSERRDVVLADWGRFSHVSGLTTDLIHVNRTGAALMARTISVAILGPTIAVVPALNANRAIAVTTSDSEPRL